MNLLPLLPLLLCLILFGVTPTAHAQRRRPNRPVAPAKTAAPTSESRVAQSDEVLVQIFGASTYGVYPDVASPGVMYATTPQGIYKTENKGLYWKRIFNPADFGTQSYDRLLCGQSKSDPSVLYAASSGYDKSRNRSVGYVWESRDGGKTWSDVSAGIIGVEDKDWTLISLLVSPKDSAVAYLLFGEKVYKTFNAGRTWGRLPVPGTQHGVADHLRMNPLQPDNLIYTYQSYQSPRNYESSDGGMSWREKTFTITYSDLYTKTTRRANSVNEIWYHPRNPNLVYALAGGLHVSENGGTTWKEVLFRDTNKVIKGPSIRKATLQAGLIKVFFSEESDDIVYVVTGDLFVSRNRGKDWKEIYSSNVSDALSPEPNKIFARTKFGLEKSHDGGGSWVSASLGLPNLLDSSFWNSVTPCSIDNAQSRIYLCQGNGFFITEDGGLNWRWKESPASSSSNMKTRRMSIFPDGTIYMNMSVATGNLGASMNSILVKITPDGGGSVIFEKADFGILGAVSKAAPNVIYRGDSISDDGGFSWRQMNLGFNLAESSRQPLGGGGSINEVTNIVSPMSPKVAYLYAHQRKSIHATTDQGESWRMLTAPEEAGKDSIILPDPKDAMTVYFGTKKAVYRSRSAGATWERVTAGRIDFGEISNFDVNPQDTNQLFITSTHGLWKTPDNGKTWQVVRQGLDGDTLDRILVSGRVVIARGSRGIYRLSDKNLNWDLKSEGPYEKPAPSVEPKASTAAPEVSGTSSPAVTRADAASYPKPERRSPQPTIQRPFTIDRECDGGNCHFEIVSFNYGRNFSISVGNGDTSLDYYFSVGIRKGTVSKQYLYSDEPNEHFTEKESGQRVDPALNRILLDVYNLGKYVIASNTPIRNKSFSETGRFAVLANLRTRF